METGRGERWKEQLDLNAPLISTRRSGAHASEKLDDDHGSGTFADTSRRIPFLWERAPGKPKDMNIGVPCCDDSQNKEILRPPKLPPSRWRPDNDENHDASNGDHEIVVSSNDYYGDYDEDDDDFSDAVETISNCSMSGVSEIDGADISISNGHSRSFIINRFLPAAKAMASSPSHSAHRNLQEKQPSFPSQEQGTKEVFDHGSTRIQFQQRIHEPEEELGSCLPPKACGFIFFLPWRPRNVIFDSVLQYFPKAKIKTQPCFSNSKTDGDANDVSDEAIDAGDGDGDGDDSVATSEPRTSIGWGVPFLGYKRIPCGKLSDFAVTEKKWSRSEGESSHQSRSKGEEDGGLECRRVTSRLPSLKSPTESWLPRALSSVYGKTKRC